MSVLGRFALTAALAGFVASTATAQQTPPVADVLSIGGTVTEIVVALGQEHRLRARDSTSTYPPRVTDLPDVGYMRALSPEGVLSVDPALILSEEGAGPPEVLDVIRAADVTFVEIPNASTVEGIQTKITTIGGALGVAEGAAALATGVGSAMADAMARAEVPEERRKRVLFILSTQGGRITASGADTAAAALIRMAGGTNALTEFTGYKQITDEAIGLAAPDVILMMDRVDHGADDDTLFDMPAIRLTPAAQSRSAVRMDGLLMLGFGPRTPQAIERLHAALYGEGS